MFETLVISGGSTKGIAFLGALHYFHAKNRLAAVHTFYGTSVGAIICLLLAVGYQPLDLVSCFRRLNFGFDLLVSKDDMQVVDYESIIAHIETTFAERTRRMLSLQDLFEIYGKTVHFVTYNYTRGRSEVLSRHRHPQLDCIEALRMSCAIPLLFKKCVHNGCVYIDGGIANNFPLDLAARRGAPAILGLNFDENLERPAEEGLFAKLNHLFFVPITLKARENIRKYGRLCTLINIIDETPYYKFNLTDEDILAMLCTGYCEAHITEGRISERPDKNAVKDHSKTAESAPRELEGQLDSGDDRDLSSLS